jgi:hypothetical protein
VHILNTLALLNKNNNLDGEKMPKCPKCGVEVTEEMNFCANCGAALIPLPPPAQVAAPAPTPQPSRPEKSEKDEKHEKGEKGEKREKTEKGEKYEKRQGGYLGSIIGGIILIVVGVLIYLSITRVVISEWIWAAFFIVIGIIVIVYAAAVATRRNPPT